jgi:excinuclease ABC subunit A
MMPLHAGEGEKMKKWKENLFINADKFDFPVHKPFYELSDESRELLWKGNSYFHGLHRFFSISKRKATRSSTG